MPFNLPAGLNADEALAAGLADGDIVQFTQHALAKQRILRCFAGGLEGLETWHEVNHTLGDSSSKRGTENPGRLSRWR